MTYFGRDIERDSLFGDELNPPGQGQYLIEAGEVEGDFSLERNIFSPIYSPLMPE